MGRQISTEEDFLVRYFRSKTRQLLALAEQVVTDHHGLKGSHREQVIRLYLEHILPRRFGIGRGMVYGVAGQRSHEADIVLWDNQNYPLLTMEDHSIFFAESVRTILEVKSRWTTEEWYDIKTKSTAVNSIHIPREPTLKDAVLELEEQIYALSHELSWVGTMSARPKIGFATIFFNGGKAMLQELPERESNIIDDAWPDLALFLAQGLVISKHYVGEEPLGPAGYLEIYHAKDDALLIFTASLLELLSDRVVSMEGDFYFRHYIQDFLSQVPTAHIEFPVMRPIPGRKVFYQKRAQKRARTENQVKQQNLPLADGDTDKSVS